MVPGSALKSAAVHRYIIILCAASSKKIQKNFEGSKAKKFQSEIKEDGLHFALRRNEVRKVNVAIIDPFKVASFESKERLRSSEIKDRQRGDHR